MILQFPVKSIRAKVIKEYLDGNKKVVCFSCGNSSKALLEEGLDVLCIGGYNGILTPEKWFSQMEIARYFPDRFDATSGHLSMELMLLLAKAYKDFLSPFKPSDDGKYLVKTNTLLEQEYEVLCGSGETLVCLKLAYPDKDFIAIYDNSNPATKYDPEAPLNELVKLLAKDIIIKEEK